MVYGGVVSVSPEKEKAYAVLSHQGPYADDADALRWATHAVAWLVTRNASLDHVLHAIRGRFVAELRPWGRDPVPGEQIEVAGPDGWEPALVEEVENGRVLGRVLVGNIPSGFSFTLESYRDGWRWRQDVPGPGEAL